MSFHRRKVTRNRVVVRCRRPPNNHNTTTAERNAIAAVKLVTGRHRCGCWTPPCVPCRRGLRLPWLPENGFAVGTSC
ncbi:hypothetical protein Hanom_Chr14g01322891 [Helianthus anomalus]